MIMLPQFFYSRPTRTVARELLGAVLCRRINGQTHRYRIVEVESYCGPRDLASHASRGKTPRNAPMFGPAGYTYVYFTYGVHWLLNIVTEREDYPAAILIRALEPLDDANTNTNGPAKLTKALDIDGTLNYVPVFNKKAGLWVEAGERVPPRNIQRAPRVGIDSVPAQYRDKLWRYYIKNSNFVSKK